MRSYQSTYRLTGNFGTALPAIILLFLLGELCFHLSCLYFSLQITFHKILNNYLVPKSFNQPYCNFWLSWRLREHQSVLLTIWHYSYCIQIKSCHCLSLTWCLFFYFAITSFNRIFGSNHLFFISPWLVLFDTI